MKTDLIDIDNVPNDKELINMLGDDLYENYLKICRRIESTLFPDIQRWAKGGRRGKYYHGYIISKKSIIIDLYLISDHNIKQLTLNFHIRKAVFNKLSNNKQLFRQAGQQAIESSEEIHKEYYPSGYDLELRLKNEQESVVSDIILTVDILSGVAVPK